MESVERRPGGVLAAAALVSRGLQAMICVLMAVLVLIVLSSVFSRYVFNSSLAWAEEISRFLLIWVVLLGAVLAYANSEHLGLDLLVKRVPPRFARPMTLLADLLVLLSAGLMVAGGVKLTTEGADSLSPALEIPFSYVYVVVPVCGALIGLLTVYNFARHLRPPAAAESQQEVVP